MVGGWAVGKPTGHAAKLSLPNILRATAGDPRVSGLRGFPAGGYSRPRGCRVEGVKGRCAGSPLEGADRTCWGQARKIVKVSDLFHLCAGTVAGNYELRYRTLRQISRKQHFIGPAQPQRTRVQRLRSENKGVSLISPCKQVTEVKSKAQPVYGCM
jgi:hypothetical protein